MKERRTPVETILLVRRISYIMLAAIGVICVVSFAILAPRVYWASFTPEKWQAHPDRRASMLEDLLEEHPLEGMTEDEVMTLLGENDNDIGYFVQDDRWVYWLGDRRTIIDSEWLLVDFENGIVSACQWTTD